MRTASLPLGRRRRMPDPLRELVRALEARLVEVEEKLTRLEGRHDDLSDRVWYPDGVDE